MMTDRPISPPDPRDGSRFVAEKEAIPPDLSGGIKSGRHNQLGAATTPEEDTKSSESTAE